MRSRPRREHVPCWISLQHCGAARVGSVARGAIAQRRRLRRLAIVIFAAQRRARRSVRLSHVVTVAAGLATASSAVISVVRQRSGATVVVRQRSGATAHIDVVIIAGSTHRLRCGRQLRRRCSCAVGARGGGTRGGAPVAPGQRSAVVLRECPTAMIAVIAKMIAERQAMRIGGAAACPALVTRA